MDSNYYPNEKCDDKEAYAPKPGQPFADTRFRLHFGSVAAPARLHRYRKETLNIFRNSPRASGESRRSRSGRSQRFYLPASLPISENSGRYIDTTMPPTTMPKNKIIMGSRAVSRSFTAASTSSS